MALTSSEMTVIVDLDRQTLNAEIEDSPLDGSRVWVTSAWNGDAGLSATVYSLWMQRVEECLPRLQDALGASRSGQ